MRVLMVGAGAVGGVLTHALEATKSNDVTYLLRRGKKLPRVKLLEARSGALSVRARPSVVDLDGTLPVVDTVILAVRGDQLDEALDILPLLRAPDELRVAVAAAGLDVVERLRARLPGRPVVQILPMFMAYPDGDHIKWWSPPLARTLICWESDPAARSFAEELAQSFSVGGVPSRAIGSVRTVRDTMLAAGMPVLAALELSHWSFDDWAHSAELRGLAADGLREGVAAVTPGPAARLVAHAPLPLVSAMLRLAPRLLSAETRAMWSVHGPKIAGQTRAMLDAIIARGDAASRATDGLKELRRRLG